MVCVAVEVTAGDGAIELSRGVPVAAGLERFKGCPSPEYGAPGYGPGPEGVSGVSQSSIMLSAASYSCSVIFFKKKIVSHQVLDLQN